MQRKILNSMTKFLITILFSIFIYASSISQIKIKDEVKIEAILKKSISIGVQFDGIVSIIVFYPLNSHENVKIIADSSIVNEDYIISELRFLSKRKYLKKHSFLSIRYRLDTIKYNENLLVIVGEKP